MKTYAGFHLDAALKCLKAGYPENAASWMNRDIGETPGYTLGDEPMPDTLKIHSFVVDDRFGVRIYTNIQYETTYEYWQGRCGEGI